MKSLILFMLFVYGHVFGAAWTLHGTKDNYSVAYVLDGGPFPSPGYSRLFIMQWDWTFDQLYPEWADSGIKVGYENTWSGYQDTLTVSTAVSGAWLSEIDLSGPADNYSGLVSWFWYNGLGLPEGEYWVDYNSDGTGRLSTTKPTDFGKWAWDGSINPSWVAAKKGFAKGHNKQPLPSPK